MMITVGGNNLPIENAILTEIASKIALKLTIELVYTAMLKILASACGSCLFNLKFRAVHFQQLHLLPLEHHQKALQIRFYYLFEQPYQYLRLQKTLQLRFFKQEIILSLQIQRVDFSLFNLYFIIFHWRKREKCFNCY